MFEIVMLLAFLYAVICPFLPITPPEKRLPSERTGSPNQMEARGSLMAESAYRSMTQPREKPTRLSLKHAHAA